MWRSLCEEIPLEATPHELDAALRDGEGEREGDGEGEGEGEGDSITEDKRATIRSLAVLIRASFTSSPNPDIADLRQLRQLAPATDEDRPSQ